MYKKECSSKKFAGYTGSKFVLESIIFKVVSQLEWQEAQEAGVFRGSPLDVADGFIHLSSAAQVVSTVQNYFAGRDDLVLVSVDTERLGDTLRWEVSRGGALFPHIYGDLPLTSVLKAVPLELKKDGTHVFPDGI